MKKLALLLSLVFVAGVSYAGEAKKTDVKPVTTTVAPNTAEKAVVAPATEKTHEVAVEVVSVDAVAKTITLKGEKANMTVPVDEKALASVKELKGGQKATLLCRDNEKGEHVAVAGVKAEGKADAKSPAAVAEKK